MGEALYVLWGIIGIACLAYGAWLLYVDWRDARVFPIATGKSLDAIATNIGFQRRVSHDHEETDAEFRARIKSGFSVIRGGRR